MNLSEMQLVELGTSTLEKTKFYSEFSKFPFNRGIIFKFIGSQPTKMLYEYLNKLDKSRLGLNTGNEEFQYEAYIANEAVVDSIYDLLNHNNIKNKWKYLDDGFFSEITENNNSRQKFRKLKFEEINLKLFSNILKYLLLRGTPYESMKVSVEDAKFMANEFATGILSSIEDRIILSEEPWGKNFIGWFKCFIILRKSDIVIFGVDEYD